MMDMLDHWQTLIAGEIAILGAIATIGTMYFLSRSDRRRKLRASRALMPAALSLVSDYAETSLQWLMAARLPAQTMEADEEVAQRVLPGLPPEPDTKIFDILKDCIEHADAGPAQSIADLLSAMQIFRSRMWGIGDRISPQHYDGKRIVMSVEVDQRMIDAIMLRAMTDRLYPFARMKTDKKPEPLDLNAVATAFRVCDLDEFQMPDVWQGLTNPYMPKN
jgi:hypothetical protein